MMMLSSAPTGIATTLIVTFVQSLYRSLSQSRVAHTGIIATTLTTFVQFLYRRLRQDTVVHIPQSHTHSLSLSHTHTDADIATTLATSVQFMQHPHHSIIGQFYSWLSPAQVRQIGFTPLSLPGCAPTHGLVFGIGHKTHFHESIAAQRTMGQDSVTGIPWEAFSLWSISLHFTARPARYSCLVGSCT